ncbi:MAG: ClpX C4-type zinc finger protein [Desulfococcaceae bacterium]|jgi:hypothetical protein|nr:ClpX C4-type zinc finger protein [Desulfococcaceae bacterium]
MSHDILYCALCGKNYNDVNKLITEDGLTLCDVCYDFCGEQSGVHHPELSEKDTGNKYSDKKS